MPQLSVMLKTVSSDCNLDCSYCYYRETLYGGRSSGTPRHRISLEMLDHFIPEYMEYVADTHTASFAWQGGEPTLAGLPFFERVVHLQARHARPPMAISNSLQTNATLMDDEWAAFLKTYAFLVGVSIDGPREIHDQLRRDARGKGSFDRAMVGAARLRQAGVSLNVLSVVGPHNVKCTRELLAFYQAEGFTHVQFIPCMDFQATEPGNPPAYLITAEQYGAFLRDLFDVWYNNGQPITSVRTFDNLLQNYVGMPNELCIHSSRCDSGLIVEHNGDTYPCDFYTQEAWRLGNVMETPLRKIVDNPLRAVFIRQKRPLPDLCQECQWLAVCKGGCARNRTPRSDGALGVDCFCDSYRMLFEHADSRFRRLQRKIQRRQRYLDGLVTHAFRDEDTPMAGNRKVGQLTSLSRPPKRAAGPPIASPGQSRNASPGERRFAEPGRNDPCPCGSGRKHKSCCGNPSEWRSYLFWVRGN